MSEGNAEFFYNIIESYKFLLSEKSHLMIFPIKFSGMSWGKSLLAYYQKIKTIKTPEFKWIVDYFLGWCPFDIKTWVKWAFWLA